MPRLSPARMYSQEKAFRTDPGVTRAGHASPHLAQIQGQFDLSVNGTLDLSENHPLWFPHVTEQGEETCPGQARRGERSFLWLGACWQVTGGGGGGRAGPALTALSSTGSDVGPDGKYHQAPKKG